MENQPEQPRHRPIRSFVLRQGRLTPAQQRALDEAMPRYGVAYAPQPLDLAAVFGRSATKAFVRFQARSTPCDASSRH